MSERNEENDEADAKTIRARADLRYLARHQYRTRQSKKRIG
jgi:hypothetical protein